ncbi:MULTISPECIES: hypothetical protein [Thiorhodovibrio]|uniref:hypothetical protein n=1 Tax=Thiorhodovibrio TaxID=61593 RepID=UPI001F5CEA08|nr:MULTISPECIES: hypothetical protein [Thiorhodovibrio]
MTGRIRKAAGKRPAGAQNMLLRRRAGLEVLALALGCGWPGTDVAGFPAQKGGEVDAVGRLAEADSGTPGLGLMVAETPCPTGAGCGGRWLVGRAVGSDLEGELFILSAVLAGVGGDAGRTLGFVGLIAGVACGRRESGSA